MKKKSYLWMLKFEDFQILKKMQHMFMSNFMACYVLWHVGHLGDNFPSVNVCLNYIFKQMRIRD